jgi:hypothetical protein
MTTAKERVLKILPDAELRFRESGIEVVDLVLGVIAISPKREDSLAWSAEEEKTAWEIAERYMKGESEEVAPK